MPPRLPKFALFTGPTCSLCDTAKAALAKVYKKHPFELQLVNIRDPGQERWRNKYVYWIPALHLDGKEVLKGRWGESEVLKALEEWKKGKSNEEEIQPRESGVDPDEVYWRDALGLKEHIFDRIADEGLISLGDETEWTDEPNGFITSRCFNCGEPKHTVRSCPKPLDRVLVDLSRALFQFFREFGAGDSERFHEAEDWKSQRLRWLEEFEPGQMRGNSLREALGLSEGDPGENVAWLHNMLSWGYPPGWAMEEDPSQAVFRRITCGYDEREEEGSDLGEFSIFGEGDEKEVLSLRLANQPQSALAMTSNQSSDVSDVNTPEFSGPSEAGDSLTRRLPGRRWASYRTSLFSSELLPIYNGQPLPPLNDDNNGTAKATASLHFPGKQHVKESPSMTIEHPWRHPDAFGPFGPRDWSKRYEKVLASRSRGRTLGESSIEKRPLNVQCSENDNDGASPTDLVDVEASEDDMDLSD